MPFCAAASQCQPGKQESVPPSLVSDRQCTACPADTFKAVVGSTSCIPISSCPDRYEESIPATPSSDRLCALIQFVSAIFDFDYDTVVGVNASSFGAAALDSLKTAIEGRGVPVIGYVAVQVRRGSIVTVFAVANTNVRSAMTDYISSGNYFVRFNGNLYEGSNYNATEASAAEPRPASNTPLLISIVVSFVVIAISIALTCYIHRRIRSEITLQLDFMDKSMNIFQNPSFMHSPKTNPIADEYMDSDAIAASETNVARWADRIDPIVTGR